MKIWQTVGSGSSPGLWYSATAVSLILLLLVFSQVDWALSVELLRQSLSFYLLGSVLLFLGEGAFTALRFYVLTPGRTPLSACFRITAWYVVLLITLPLRLGEFAAILLLKKYLAQNSSPAMMNILVQRLFDVLILCSIFLLVMLSFSAVVDSAELQLIALSCLILVSLFLLYFDSLLALVLRPLLGKGRPQGPRSRKLLRMLLQARIWYRFRLSRRACTCALLITLGKWLCNLCAFAMLMCALQLPLDLLNSLVLATAYNFLTVIPLQTIGGFGVSEAGLTALLLLSGLSLTLAASATILLRLVIIMVPFLFWILVMAVLSLLKRRAHG